MNDRYTRCLEIARTYGRDLLDPRLDDDATEVVGEIAISACMNAGHLDFYEDGEFDRTLPDAWDAFSQARSEQLQRAAAEAEEQAEWDAYLACPQQPAAPSPTVTAPAADPHTQQALADAQRLLDAVITAVDLRNAFGQPVGTQISDEVTEDGSPAILVGLDGAALEPRRVSVPAVGSAPTEVALAIRWYLWMAVDASDRSVGMVGYEWIETTSFARLDDAIRHLIGVMIVQRIDRALEQEALRIEADAAAE